MNEQKVKVAEWNINYIRVGNGPHAVLCMPGTLGNIMSNFKPQLEGFDREKFTVVCWDPPGYGKSRPPERDFPPDFYEQNADYAYQFMQAIGINKFSILGWCGGGRTAIILAAKRPDVVQNLVVWACNAYMKKEELDMFLKYAEVAKWNKKLAEPLIEEYGEEYLNRYWGVWLAAMQDTVNNRDGEICRAFLKDVKCPTLILHGQNDPLIHVSHAKYLHEHIEGSQVHIYPEGKHDIHLREAEDYNKRVQEFLLATLDS